QTSSPSLHDALPICFTSTDPVGDVIRLAKEQEAELVVVERAPPALLAGSPCDVALLTEARPFEPGGPVLVPFGGGRDEWPALELDRKSTRLNSSHLG